MRNKHHIAWVLAVVFAGCIGTSSIAQDRDVQFKFNEQPEDKILYERPHQSQADVFAKLRRSDKGYSYDTGIVGSGPESVKPLLPGTSVPGFRLTGLSGNNIEVAPDELQKPLIITFYRGGWCPYCNLHLAELRKAEAELLEQGFDVWFISPDKPELLYESLEEPDIGYTLYSDSTLNAAKTFGVAYELERDALDKFFNGGVSLHNASGQKHNLLPTPGTFLVGTDGLVHFQYVNPNFKTRLDPQVLLAAADSYLKAAGQRVANN